MNGSPSNTRLHLTTGPVIRLAGQAGRPGRYAAPVAGEAHVRIIPQREIRL